MPLIRWYVGCSNAGMTKTTERNGKPGYHRAMNAQKSRPAQQQQRQPGRETAMRPRPESSARFYRAAGKLKGLCAPPQVRTALVRGRRYFWRVEVASGIERRASPLFTFELGP